MNGRISVLLLTGLVLLSSGCSGKLLPTHPTAHQPAAQPFSSDQADLLSRRCDRGAATIIGNAPDGSIYALYRPERWNGDLVIYAHGIIAPFLPVAR